MRPRAPITLPGLHSLSLWPSKSCLWPSKWCPMQAHVFSHSHLLKMTDGPAIVDALLSRPVRGLNILLEKAFHHALLNAAKVRNGASKHCLRFVRYHVAALSLSRDVFPVVGNLLGSQPRGGECRVGLGGPWCCAVLQTPSPKKSVPQLDIPAHQPVAPARPTPPAAAGAGAGAAGGGAPVPGRSPRVGSGGTSRLQTQKSYRQLSPRPEPSESQVGSLLCRPYPTHMLY
jgi:hypothetical protein